MCHSMAQIRQTGEVAMQHRQEAPNRSDDAGPFAGHGLVRAELEEAEDAFADRFSHLALEVTDLDRSEQWYQEVIGADLLGRGLTAEPRPHSVLQMNSGQLLILVHNAAFKQGR